ncbi:60 kDa SS-A/Ro ribonucleoprotein, partial [Blyttiomyces sp. JEL0837]
MITATPQSNPIPGKESIMTPNISGGHTFTVTPKTHLLRFLILGSESGSYYATEQQLTMNNVVNIIKMIQSDEGITVVKTVVEVSEAGRAAKQDMGIFVLALCIKMGDEGTRKAAYDAVGKVCRIPTTLFQLISFTSMLKGTGPSVDVDGGEGKEFKNDEGVETDDNTLSKRKIRKSPPLRGKGCGRGMKKAIANWYNDKELGNLVYLVTKYKNRQTWTHADVLRVAHIAPKTRGHDLVFKYLTHGLDSVKAGLAASGDQLVKEIENMGIGQSTNEVDMVDVKEEMESNGVKSVEHQPMTVAKEVGVGMETVTTTNSVKPKTQITK